MTGFAGWIASEARSRRSKIVLALDLPPSTPRLLQRGLNLLNRVYESICAVKVNRHMFLPLGLKGVGKLVENAHGLGLPAIMDCKLNDIGATNLVMAEWFFRVGFDALTVSPYVGWEEGLQPVFNLARKEDKGLLVLSYMSHQGAEKTFEKALIREDGRVKPAYLAFAQWALEWGADGVIVGATRPNRIAEVRRLLRGRIPIYSPGVGVQGGSPEEALARGADYLVVGRSIINADDPREAASILRERTWKPGGNLST